MAIPLMRASISHAQMLFQIPSLSSSNLVTKKNKSLHCASTEPNLVRSELSFCVGSHLIPHPNKIEKGGEDAFTVSSYDGGLIAVADGVSGWAEQNVDPSLFPRELMANISRLLEDEEVKYDPQTLLRKAHVATSSIGSATLIIAMLERNGMLKIANVGDCELRVIRKGQIIFSTSPQEHYFDCPYQLSSEMAGQTYLDAVVSGMELMEGDIIVMGSDGLFDNVFDHEIVSTIATHSDVSVGAKALANLARNHSMDSEFESPYSLEARSRGYDIPFWKKILGMKLTGMDCLFIGFRMFLPVVRNLAT
ncbi:probable protein phosphatase 2C 26 isoform X2 [Tripterygium wilfordii]|uniref:probable protein phosphatase 2C 26 isoform X2 n=1 Tax=Tripterygium wilfordii TaxID=458696 RepID=UPI0018F834C6|nr:probable protein phosphatase 2C 26 isoform X2 [Tripterygium wilfordii]